MEHEACLKKEARKQKKRWALKNACTPNPTLLGLPQLLHFS